MIKSQNYELFSKKLINFATFFGILMLIIPNIAENLSGNKSGT